MTKHISQQQLNTQLLKPLSHLYFYISVYMTILTGQETTIGIEYKYFETQLLYI